MIPAAVAVPFGSALLEGVAGAFGGRSQSRAAQRAANAQIQAQREALELQKQMFGETKEMYRPYQEAGQRGATGYEDRITNFTNPELQYVQKDFNQTNWKDPGYDYRLNEAQRLIDAQTSSKGMTLGSGALKAMQTRGQDMASQEYQNAFDRWQKDSALRYGQASDQWNRDYNFQNQDVANWANLMNTGMQATQGVATAAGNYVTGATPLITGQGTAQGQADLAAGGAAALNWSNIGKGAGDVVTEWGKWYDSQNKKNKNTDTDASNIVLGVTNQNYMGRK